MGEKNIQMGVQMHNLNLIYDLLAGSFYYLFSALNGFSTMATHDL